MNTKLEKVTVYGSKKAVGEAMKLLKELVLPDEEGKARLVLQKLIEEKNIKADILYDGNGVWNGVKILENFRKIKKAGWLIKEGRGYVPVGEMLRIPSSEGRLILNDYFYKFLSLVCGSIAHYNIWGWANMYPGYEDLVMFFGRNEFNQRVLDHLPEWYTDARRIVEQIEKEIKTKESAPTNWCEILN